MLSLPSASTLQKKPYVQDLTLLSSRLLPLHSSHNNLFGLESRTPSFLPKSKQNNLGQEPSTKYPVPPSTSNQVSLASQQQSVSDQKRKLFGFNLDCSFPTRPRRGLKSDRSPNAPSVPSLKNVSKITSELEGPSLLNLGALTERNAQINTQTELKKSSGKMQMPSQSVEKFREYFEQNLEDAPDNKKRIYQRTAQSIVNVSNESQSTHVASSSNVQYTDEVLMTEPSRLKREDSFGKKNLLKHITHSSTSYPKEKSSLQGSFESLKRETPLMSSKLLTPSLKQLDNELIKNFENEYISTTSQKLRIRDILNHQANKSHRLLLSEEFANKNNNILIMEEASKDQFSKKKELLPSLNLNEMRKSIQNQRNGSQSGDISIDGGYLHKRTTTTVSPLEQSKEEPMIIVTPASGNEPTQSRSILKQRPVKVRSSRCLENASPETVRKIVTFQLKKYKDFREVVNELYKIDDNEEISGL